MELSQGSLTSFLKTLKNEFYSLLISSNDKIIYKIMKYRTLIVFTVLFVSVNQVLLVKINTCLINNMSMFVKN